MPSRLLPAACPFRSPGAGSRLPVNLLSGRGVSRAMRSFLMLILLMGSLLSLSLLLPSGVHAVIPLPGLAQDVSAFAPTSTGADNNTRMLWTDSNRVLTLWNTKPDGTFVSRASFGPYSDAGGNWTPTHVAVGTDGRAHVLWVRTDGAISLWSADINAGTFTYYAYGPYTGWTAVGLAVGPDNKTRVLWNNTDGSMDLWDQDSGTGAYTVHTFGPFSDAGGAWTARAVAVGPDNKTRVIWSQPRAC